MIMNKALNSRYDILTDLMSQEKDSQILRIVLMHRYEKSRYKLKRTKKDFLLQPLTTMTA